MNHPAKPVSNGRGYYQATDYIIRRNDEGREPFWTLHVNTSNTTGLGTGPMVGVFAELSRAQEAILEYRKQTRHKDSGSRAWRPDVQDR